MIAWLVVPPLVDQVASFADHVPGYIDRFQGLRRDYARIRARYPELGPFDEEVAQLADGWEAPSGTGWSTFRNGRRSCCSSS